MKKPMVTRTILTTEVTVLCLDLIKAEPFNKTVTLPRTYKDEKAMMKKVSAIIDNDEVKAVHVVDTKVNETLYGMTEEQFIAMAEVLPSRSKTADQ
nr:MAG TPA: hypothetical protein [Caudoviricetes sp.]